MHDSKELDSDGVDWELFGLELDYVIETRIKPELRAALQRRQAEFDASLQARPEVKDELERQAQERADYQRRVERRRYVESGQAKREAARQQPSKVSQPCQESVSVLAQVLALHWKVQFVRDGRRNGRQH